MSKRYHFNQNDFGPLGLEGFAVIDGCQILDCQLTVVPKGVPQWLRTAIEDALNDHAFDLIEVQQDQEAASKDDADYHAKF